jgi:hypothetical protein
MPAADDQYVIPKGFAVKKWMDATVLATVAATLLWACSGGSNSATPSAPSSPTLSSVVVSGATPGIGASSQFNATANFSNSTNQNVSSQATWQSTTTSVATVSSSGSVTATGAGETDIRATYQSLTGTLHITVAAPPRFTLFGVISQTGSSSAVVSAAVSVLDGANVGKTTTTDGNGYYSLGGLLGGSFTLEAYRSGYSTTDRSVTLTADQRFDFSIPAVASSPVPSPSPTPTPVPGPNGASCPASSVPGGVTAVCNDGTYSSSQNRSGTCSHHGGVLCWICPGPICQ